MTGYMPYLLRRNSTYPGHIRHFFPAVVLKRICVLRAGKTFACSPRKSSARRANKRKRIAGGKKIILLAKEIVRPPRDFNGLRVAGGKKDCVLAILIVRPLAYAKKGLSREDMLEKVLPDFFSS